LKSPDGFKDHFSGHAADYARFRPQYPDELFRYLAGVAPSQRLAWDCATGNGQAAVALAGTFERVVATDASAEQIANATPHPKVEYRVAPAEASEIEANTVDLISVAQALHWFDLDRFYAETRRVLNERGVIAVWAYDILEITPAIDAVVNHYYDVVVGAYWPPERVLVEKFGELPFPFEEIAAPQFEMRSEWTLQHLVGYLGTWSATQRFVAANQRDPLETIEGELRSAWSDPDQLRNVSWPLTLRVGR
jgi:SAM-dependent methyltransferase